MKRKKMSVQVPRAREGTFQKSWESLLRAQHCARDYEEVATNEPGAELLLMHGVWAASVSPKKHSVPGYLSAPCQGSAHRIGRQ